MKVLITGLSGFTGRYMADELSAHGHEVIGLSANLLDAPALNDEVKTIVPDAVVHLAGIAFVAHKTAMDFYNTHVQGTLNLLSALANLPHPIQKVLLASSATVYGNSVEGQYSENTPLKPANDYSVSKLAMEYMAWLWREKLPIVIARPFNYTGVGQSANFLLPKVVAHFQAKKPEIELGNIQVWRDFSDVRDVVAAYRKLLESPESKGAINVCSETVYSVGDVLGILQELAGYKITVRVNPQFVRHDEVKILYGSCAKLRSLIGDYNPRPLKETLQWMYSNENSDH